jgi:hypothetical protein
MPQPDPIAVKHAQAKIAEIQRALSAMHYLCSGTLSKRMKLCGKPQCRCGVDPAARHGPYYEWTHLKAGKLQHRTLSPAQAQLMRLAIADYRKAKKLLRAWEAHTQRLIELTAPE